MDDKVKISDLPADDIITGTELMPVSDGGDTKSVETRAVKDYVIKQILAAQDGHSASGAELLVHDAEGELKKIPVKAVAPELEGDFLTLNGEQTISGKKSFEKPVAVGAPSEGSHAATKGYVDKKLDGKVDAQEGKGLSTNDFTDLDKKKLDSLAKSGEAVVSVNGKTGDVNLDAAGVGAAPAEPIFSESAELALPVGSGETTITLWGKVKKAISSLIFHMADKTAHITKEERSTWNGKQSKLAIDVEIKEGSVNPVSGGAVFTHAEDMVKHITEKEREAWDAKQTTENLVTNFDLPSSTTYPSSKLVDDTITGHTRNDDVHVTKEQKEAWTAKQGKLSDSQMSAVNSGITSSKVDKYDQCVEDVKTKQDKLEAGINLDDRPIQGSTNPIASGAVYEALTGSGDGGNAVIDSTPTQGSMNPVQSNGVYEALAKKQDALIFDSEPLAGSNNPVKSSGIKSAIDNAMSKCSGSMTVKELANNDVYIDMASKIYSAFNFIDLRGENGTTRVITLRADTLSDFVQTADIFLESNHSGTIQLQKGSALSGNVRLRVDGVYRSDLKFSTGSQTSFHIQAKYVHSSDQKVVILCDVKTFGQVGDNTGG